MEFSNKQKLAIKHDGSDLIVSASAGAGKTATLIEYIYQKIANDKDGEKVSISEILAMTFTDAAAQSMKKKLFKRINDEIEAGNNDPHIKKQAELLPSADICTIDSFCTNILNQYCYVIGWDPARPKSVLDKNTVAKIKNDVAHKLVVEELKKDNKLLFDFVAAYSNNGNNTNNFERMLVEISDKIEKFADKNKWYQIVLNYYHNNDFTKMDDANKKMFFAGAINACDSIIKSQQIYLDLVKDKTFAYDPYDARDRIKNVINKYEDIKNDLINEDHSVFHRIADLEIILSNAKLFIYPSSKDGFSKQEVDDLKVLINEDRKKYEIVCEKQSVDAYKKLQKYALEYKDFSNQQNDLKDKVILLIDLLKEYQNRVDIAKNELNGIDFVDMEKASIEILKKDKSIADRLRNKYKYILVDEYQDSNDIQEELIQLICRKDPGNVFRVGDVKQSIYGFRSAKPSLMRNIMKNATKDEKIVFENNYRSSDFIIQFNNLLYKTIMNIDGYNDTYTDENDTAFAGTDEQKVNKEKCEICLIEYNKEFSDVELRLNKSFYVVNKIKQMREDSIRKKEELKDKWESLNENSQKKYFYDNGIYPDWKDYVILVKNHDHKKILQEAFESLGVPTFFIINKGYYDDSAVITVMSWLKWIANIDDEIAMYSVLSSPYYEWSNDDIVSNTLN